MGFQSVEEKSDRQQVGAAARAEAAGDEGSMHRRGSLAPLRLSDTALSKKAGRGFLGIAQAGGTAPVACRLTPADLAAQDRVLVPRHQKLGILGEACRAGSGYRWPASPAW